VGVAQDDGPGEPAEEKTEADRLYEEGMVHFEARRFAMAAQTFVNAYEADPNPFLAYNAGRAYENDGRLEEARSWFNKALADDPPPEVAKLAEDGVIRLGRAEATLRDKLTAKTGVIAVDADTSANVFLEGQLKGRTPVEFELDPGDYRIEVVADGFETFVVVVSLDAGETERVNATLKEPEGIFSWVGWTGVGLTSAGTAAALTGIFFASEARADYDEAQNLTAAEIRGGDRFSTLRDSGEQNKTLALVFYSAGGGMVALGVACILFDLATHGEGELPASATDWRNCLKK